MYIFLLGTLRPWKEEFLAFFLLLLSGYINVIELVTLVMFILSTKLFDLTCYTTTLQVRAILRVLR